MGYAIAMAPCITCRKVFGFNPHTVPSTSALTGTKEPVCSECMALINERRKSDGLEPFPILPNAYAPIDETEL